LEALYHPGEKLGREADIAIYQHAHLPSAEGFLLIILKQIFQLFIIFSGSNNNLI
jgi:hypothetical protein